MGYRLNIHYKQQELETFEARLNHLTTKILLSGNQLNICANKVTNYKALQMDEAIVCDDDEMNDIIDIMEDYIINQRLILQDMAEKVIFAKKILLQQNNYNASNNTDTNTTANISCATDNNNIVATIIPTTTNIKSSE